MHITSQKRGDNALTTFAFDACVVIGFFNIGYLDLILKKLRELSDKVYMAENNVYEVMRKSVKQKEILQKSGVFEEIPHDNVDFQNFTNCLSKENIFLSDDDRCVPYVGMKKKTTYLVSSDGNVVLKTDKIRKRFKIKYMAPITPVYLLHYLYLNGKLEFDEYLKIVLEYFKYEEMQNIYDAITQPDRAWSLEDMRARFQSYKDPLLQARMERIDGSQTKVSMYGYG